MRSTRRALSILAGMTIGLAFTVGGRSSPTAAQGNCDPNYDMTSTGQCVPGGRDYDCPELWGLGIGDIPVIGTDWMRLDGYQDFQTGEWISLPDGLGCEWDDAGAEYDQLPQSSALETTARSALVDIDNPGVSTDSRSVIGNNCLADGDFACALENFESAYASLQDAATRSDLYEYYLLNGDMWQHGGNLDSARKSYSDAVSLDPARIEATERLQRLAGYSAVEFFDPFETFGEPGLNETFDGGATVHRVVNGNLEMSSTMPDWVSARWFSHTPVNSEYAVAAEVTSVGPTSAIDLILAHGPADEGFHFMVDPALQVWSITYRNPDGSWTDMILPTSYAGLIQDPIERLEVQIINSTPRFLVNGVELTASFDMSWMQIPQTGDSGVAVESSAANLTAPISATFDSFGIYAL